MKSIDKAVFLHKSSFSSSSLLVTYYTEKNGLQKFIFKGGKKRAHHLFPMAFSEIEYYGRNNDLLNITNTESVFPQSFQFNPVKSTIAFFIGEVIRKSVEPGDRDSQLFSFLEKQTKRLEEEEKIHLYPIQFLVEFTNSLGIYPLIEEGGEKVFNIDSGRFQHTASIHQKTYVGESVNLIISFLNKEEPPSTNKKVREESLKILLNYYSTHIPSFNKLESYEILKEVLG